jgi:hypothetical protein
MTFQKLCSILDEDYRKTFRILKFAISCATCVATLALAPLTAQANGAQVSSIRPLLLAAIETGRAEGTLAWPGADAIRRQFGSTAPIRISVRVVKPLTDPLCKRLEVTTSQDGVIEAGKRPETKSLKYEINYCRDGRFPEEVTGRRGL